jgi:Uma2 family endonuclease
MAATARATIEDLYHVKGKAEIVDGEIVLMSPTGGLPGIAGGIIYASLLAHQRRAGGGYALPDNVGFVVELPRRRSFSPDAAFHRGPKPTMKFIQGAPALAVEVRSEDDYGPAAEKAMAAKRADYFAAGTEVVWDVDLQGQETIRAYRALEPGSRVFRRGDVADAEPAVPGWRFPVDELFE